MTAEGEFDTLELNHGHFSGKALLDHLDQRVRQAYYTGDQSSVDLMWYLWCGAKSPVFGKDRMTTFERCFIGDKSLESEPMNPYYHCYEDPAQCRKILEEFGLDPEHSHIVKTRSRRAAACSSSTAASPRPISPRPGLRAIPSSSIRTTSSSPNTCPSSPRTTATHSRR